MLEGAEVSADILVKFGDMGLTKLSLLTSLVKDDDRRASFLKKPPLELDQDKDIPTALSVANLVSVCEAATTTIHVENELQAQRKSQDLPPKVGDREVAQLREIFEAQHFQLTDMMVPSDGYFEREVGELERLLEAEPLTDLTNRCQRDVNRNSGIAWDNGTNQFKTEKRFGVPMPEGSEGLSTRLRTMGVAWHLLRLRSPSNAVLASASYEVFDRYVGWLKGPVATPTLDHVLTYGLEIGKQVSWQMNREGDLRTAFGLATGDEYLQRIAFLNYVSLEISSGKCRAISAPGMREVRSGVTQVGTPQGQKRPLEDAGGGPTKAQRMVQMTVRDALEEWGEDLVIAATGAIAKKGKEGEVRVIYDGSNGITTIPGIRVRDQVRHPVAQDGKAVLSECAEEGGPHCSLDIHYSGAHRQVAVEKSVWGRQACQVRGIAAEAAKLMGKQQAEADRKVWTSTGVRARQASRGKALGSLPPAGLDEVLWVNTVGTFGIAPAGYWGGRAGAAVARLLHDLLGYQHALWSLLYSDDGWLIGRGKDYHVGLVLYLFILVVLGAPLAWHKAQGGVQSALAGYALDVGRLAIGISESRTQWAVRWLEDKIAENRVQLGELREGLGRLQFIAGPLEHVRPFLGLVYAWACAGWRYARSRLPVMILCILKFTIAELKRCRMVECLGRVRDFGGLFRLDAKAEGEEVAIGGWRSGGNQRTRAAAWFAVRVNRRNVPWAHAPGGKDSAPLPRWSCWVPWLGSWYWYLSRCCRRRPPGQ